MGLYYSFQSKAENLEIISTYEYNQYFDFIGKAKLIVVGTSNFYIRFEKHVSEPLTHPVQSLDLNLKVFFFVVSDTEFLETVNWVSL